MRLKEIIIKNFRGFQGSHRVSVNDLTVFIGKNDVGKSTIFDALAIFFENKLCKIDIADACVFAESEGEIVIGCVFDNLPSKIVLDESFETNLKDEYMLNQNGDLEIHKVYEYNRVSGTQPKDRTFAIVNHPSHDDCRDLLQMTNTALKARAKSLKIEVTDNRKNAELRKAIRQNFEPLELEIGRPLELTKAKEDAKQIWDQIDKALPDYALFRADRPSTDEDAEAQDPLKIAVKDAIKKFEITLKDIEKNVIDETQDIADRTIEKLKEIAPDLASKLNAENKSDPKWDSLFKLTITGDHGISVNKRGSGVRRLILFSFFRAQAEKLKNENSKSNLIYAIEEPETAQHPDQQRKVIESLIEISESDNNQVMLTTHSPEIASLLPTNSIRFIEDIGEDEQKVKKINEPDDDVIGRVVDALGIMATIPKPLNNMKVLVCVEGPTDVTFLKTISKKFHEENSDIVDIENNPSVLIIPLGGDALKAWVEEQYLRSLGLIEIHIYDSDGAEQGAHKHQNSIDKVNSLGGGSLVFVTQKREIENYYHSDIIKQVLCRFCPDFDILVEDNTDVERQIKNNCNGRGKFGRKSLKVYLADEVTPLMTIDHLKERDGYDEIKGWLDYITEKCNP